MGEEMDGCCCVQACLVQSQLTERWRATVEKLHVFSWVPEKNFIYILIHHRPGLIGRAARLGTLYRYPRPGCRKNKQTQPNRSRSFVDINVVKFIPLAPFPLTLP